MSAANNLLIELAGIGAEVQHVGAQLILRAGSKPVPPALVRRVKEAKADLIAELHEKSCRVVHWLNDHPAPSPAGRCAWCGQVERPDAVVLPFGTVPGNHTWLHAGCWSSWHKARLAAAAVALGTPGASS